MPRKISLLAVAAVTAALAIAACARTPTGPDAAPQSVKRISNTSTPDAAEGPGTFGSGHVTSTATDTTAVEERGGGTFGSGH